jgi:hypothetical protein
MKPLQRSLLCLSLLAVIPSASVVADDTWLHKGQADAATVKTLKGGPADDAAIVPVFHGRLLACLCCRRPICCCEPVCYDPCAVSSYPSAGPAGYGYGDSTYNSQPGYAYRAPRYDAPSYSGQGAPEYYSPAPARAVVTLPRLGLSFTLGSGNSLLASRSTLGNELRGSMRPAEEQRALPPADIRPDQYRYDGGPSAPIPLPGTRTQPLPSEPTTAPALNNRVKASPSKPTWLAYGERPVQTPSSASRNLLVNGGGR